MEKKKKKKKKAPFKLFRGLMREREREREREKERESFSKMTGLPPPERQ